MRGAEEERTGSAPVAGVICYRRAMSDAEEERTGSAPVAGVVCKRRAMRDAEEGSAGSAPAAGAVSHGMQRCTTKRRKRDSRRCGSDGGEDGFIVCFEMMILVAGAMRAPGDSTECS